MDRRTKVCILIIVIGLGNFLAYTIMYMFLGGDAMNGYVHVDPADGARHHYLVAKGVPFEVSGPVWVYSAVHSISIWVTVGAVLLAMLTLAKDRIISSMHSTVVRGRTFITILATIITLTTAVATVYFILIFARKLAQPKAAPPTPATQVTARSWR